MFFRETLWRSWISLQLPSLLLCPVGSSGLDLLGSQLCCLQSGSLGTPPCTMSWKLSQGHKIGWSLTQHLWPHSRGLDDFLTRSFCSCGSTTPVPWMDTSTSVITEKLFEKELLVSSVTRGFCPHWPTVLVTLEIPSSFLENTWTSVWPRN